MTTKLELNVQQSNGTTRPATILVEEKNLINCIFPNINDKTITEAQLKKLQETGRKSGDLGIIESADLSPQEKIQQAKINGYNEFYDIKLSNDKKYYVITIKPTSMFYPDPRTEDIKKDFGLRENVFLYNNLELVKKREDRTWDSRNHNYDYDKLRGGDTFYIPIEEAHFTNGPAGFWRRLI